MTSALHEGVKVTFGKGPLDAFYGAGIVFGELIGDAPTSSRNLSQVSYQIDAGARVVKATAIIKAGPPGWTPVSQVAEVRADIDGRLVVDFGRMRTVRGVRINGNDVKWVLPWLGSQFGPATGAGNVKAGEGGVQFDFSELQTERALLVPSSSSSPLDLDGFVANGQVMLSSAPADLELLVAGKRAWFQPGEAKRGAYGLFGTGVNPTAEDYFVTAVDMTEALAGALAKAAVVQIELRATTPGVMAVAHQVSLQRVHTVAFPEGPERVVTLAEENTTSLLLPVPAAAATWTVLGVALTVAAKLPPTRVVPAVGPTIAPDLELVLDAEHAVAVNIPANQTTPFGALTAVRARVYVEPGGTELGGTLLADAGGEPGAPIPGGELAPLTVAEAPRAADQPLWVTLATARPVAVPRGLPLWVSLQASRGTVVMPLVSGGNPVRRGLPGGPWRTYANVTTLPLQAAVRLVGTGPEGAPIDALQVELAGKTPVLSITPQSDGTTAQFLFDTPVAATSAISGNTITLTLTASTPGSYRFKDVQVLYRLLTDPE